MKLMRGLIFFSSFSIFTCGAMASQKVILFVWDGLRPDSVTQKDTPTLYNLKKKGVNFKNNHSTFPTFTMMNAQSFATGDFAGTTGYYGNSIYAPYAEQNGTTDSRNKKVDFSEVIFTEDYKILQELNRPDKEEPLFYAENLVSEAHKAGLTTAVVGKSGPAFLQDYKSNGFILDEAHVYPLSFAKELQKNNYALPARSPNAFPAGELVLAADNGDPTSPVLKKAYLKDSEEIDPTDRRGSPYIPQNNYLADIFINYILPHKKPDFSVFWLRNPDSTQHDYGPGSYNYHTALQANDKILANLFSKLKALGIEKETDIIIVSDHAHSNVSGDTKIFPLRKIEDGKVTEIDNEHGFPVSGNVRSVKLMAADANLKALKIRAYDSDSSEFEVPEKLTEKDVVIAPNGGAEYAYVPFHNKEVVAALVKFYQSHQEYDSVFVSDVYGRIPGTLPLSFVKLKNSEGRNPDIVVSMSYDEKQVVNGLPGTLYSSNGNYFIRGNHGSFSPIEVHNTLLAYGESFKKHHTDILPTGNVDVAPTIAHILNIPFQNTDGRVLFEALAKSKTKPHDFKVTKYKIKPEFPATDLEIFNVDNTVEKNKNYSFVLQLTKLSYQGKTYEYLDKSKAKRW